MKRRHINPRGTQLVLLLLGFSGLIAFGATGAQAGDGDDPTMGFAFVLDDVVEVYLVKAETGQLPEALPAYAPKDPSRGQQFAYEITAQGFVLRCQAKDPREDKVWEYEFQVRD